MIQACSLTESGHHNFADGVHRVYRPLLVTAELASPLCGDAPMLDALLEAAMVWRMPSIMASKNGHRHQTSLRPQRGQSIGEVGRMPIPMMRQMIGGWNVACCSSPILSEANGEWVEHINRKFDISNADLLAPKERIKISVADGSWRSYHLPRRVRSIHRVRWFALGKGKDMRKLLKTIPAIGGETNVGYGRVSQWTVEHIEDDLTWFADAPDGGKVLMRPLPNCDELPQGLVGWRKGFGACVSPYWHSSRFCEVVQPC